ncbi:MAG: YciI family protein [Pseudomonadota bacterium]
MPTKVSANALLAKTSRFKRQPIYWILSHPVGDLTAVNCYREEFRGYLAEIDANGQLIASGPILTEDGQFHAGDYAMLLKASDLEQAKTIAAADPWLLRGLRTNRVVPFLIGDGDLYRLMSDA